MGFIREDLAIPGVALIRSRRHIDERGHFEETWARNGFAELGIVADFVQDNESASSKVATVRGLHLQKAPFEQAKLIRVVRGKSYHVAVDVRPKSPTFGRWCGVHLSSEAGAQLFVPRGFAHGYMTLEVDTVVAYKADAPYTPSAEAGIRWDDPSIAIAWPETDGPVVLSDRDRVLPSFRSYCEGTAALADQRKR